MDRREIEVAAFDWSGTLSDDRDPVWEANMRLLERFGLPVMGFEEWLPKTTLTAAEFLQAQGVNKPTKELLDLYRQYLHQVKEEGIVPRPYPDAHSLLDYLRSRGTVVAVLSSHPTQHLLDEASRFGLSEFVSMFVGDSIDKAEGLLLLSKSLRVREIRRLMYVDDTVFGTRATKAVGAFSAAVSTGYHTKARLILENPDVLFESLTELKFWLEGSRAT